MKMTAEEFSIKRIVELEGHAGLASLDSELGPEHQFSVTVRVLHSAHSPAGPHPLVLHDPADFQGPRELSERHDHTDWKGSTEGSSIPSGWLHIHVPLHHLNPEEKQIL